MNNCINVELIIFDLDGTLVDSQEGIVHSIQHMIDYFQLPVKTPQEIRSYIGTGVEDLVRKSTGSKGKIIPEGSIKYFKDTFKQIGNVYARLYPNVIEILEYFKNKKKVIITNRQYDMAVATLQHFNIEKYFTDLTGGDDIDCMKPSSCPLVKSIKKYDIEKNKTIIVGDMAIDIIAGQSAGIYTCACMGGIGKKDDIKKAGPDFMIEDLIELKRIVC